MSMDRPVISCTRRRRSRDGLEGTWLYGSLCGFADVVRPYMSGADNVAAFVGDRPCSIVQDGLDGHYLLKMKGSAGDKMSFRYYCDSLKHVFVTEECARYTDATSWGSEAEYNVLPLETAFKLVNMRAVFTVDYYEPSILSWPRATCWRLLWMMNVVG